MVKNTLQKAKLDQKKQWKKENKKKKIQKKFNKKNQIKKPKEKYQKTLEILIVKNKDQKDLDWSQIFKNIKEKYQNFIAKVAYVEIEDETIQCSDLHLFGEQNDEQEQKNKNELWNQISQIKWQGRFRLVLFLNLNDIKLAKNNAKRLFQQKVHFIRIKNEKNNDDFDNDVLDLNKDHYQIFQEQQDKNIQEIMIENLILKMDKKKKKEKIQKVKLWYGNLKKNQWYSFTNYLQIQTISNNDYICLNKDQEQVTFQKQDLLEMQSAQQYQKQQGLNQSDLIQKFLSCRNQILKVVYYQKYTSDQVKKLIEKHENLESIQQDEKWLKEIIKGKRIELICNLQQNSIFLGKISVKNMEINTVQQIDARSIQQFIVDQVKYYLIQNNQTNNNNVKEQNTEIKESDWFSYIEYYKIIDLINEKIIVQNHKEEQKELRKKFLEQECLSADNFVKKKKMSLRDIVEKLKGIHGQVFTIEYKVKKQFDESFNKFKIINKEIQQEPKRLRKICKEITFNQRTVSVAKQLEIDEILSYSKIYDLDKKQIIEIDHRSISSLIFNNMKYCKA